MKLRSPGVEEDIGSMKGYGQFCPIAKASEVLAERWTFLVVRELLFGSRRYNDIRRGVPRMSPGLLAARLKQLESVGVIERVSGAGRGVEYQLTEAGQELKPLIMQLADWGHRWTYTKFRREDLDPGFLMWSIRRNLELAFFPPHVRTVVYVEFNDRVPLRRWWLVIEAGEADLCVKDPGHEIDLYLYTNLITLTKYFDVRITLAEAKSTGQFRLLGSSALIRSVSKWLGRPSAQTVPPPRES
jgi:DNA-binding HxlR family transcriptional regulator